jgi:integrase
MRTPRNQVRPIERFPAEPRADGRFQKRINGDLYYFTGTRDEALAKYNAIRDDLYAGRAPRIAEEAMPRITLKDVTNRCLRQKEHDRDSGRISAGWFDDFKVAVLRFGNFRVGGVKMLQRPWHELGAGDFGEYARHLHAKYGPHAYNRERSCVAAMFNMALEFGWIAKPIKLGRAFPKRTPGDARGSRKDWLLTVPILKALYGKAGPQMRAMILLGLNGGFGPGDCAELPCGAVEIPSKRIHFNRPKNGIPRDMPMWPETLKSLRRVIGNRTGDDLTFRTKRGNAWTGNTIAHEFAKACRRAKVNLPDGVGLNACRHTFATYANEVQDRDAYKRLMGRKISEGIDETYIDRIFLPRLKRVVNHVHRRLSISKIVLARK